MTAAGTEICDGCDREGPAQQLAEVILPSGAMTVCPECRYHAEELAERSDADCEGCGETVTAADLARTDLPDGTDMILCSDCRADVSAGERPGDGFDSTETDDAKDTGPTANGAAATSASPSADATSDPADAPTSSTDGSASAADAAPTPEAVTDGATGKPATTQNACDQCGGLYSIELYQVVTVDGRTEQFCPDCKDDGIEQGIVRDVELRRAQAYEALGLAGSADSDEIRQAYLEQVKEVHPDRANGSRSEFMLVQQAYERLSDD